MTSEQVNYITKDGFEKLKEELHQLKTVKRKEMAWRIQQAKELGDLSENAEYTEAKNEQAFLEGRIAELENVIKNAQIIDQSQKTRSGGTLQVGATVKVACEGKEMEFSIVGSQEADPRAGKISNESPLGRALLGHMVGDMVDVQTPRGVMKYQLTKIL